MRDDAATATIPDLTNPDARSAAVMALLGHVSFAITDALVWLPARGGPCAAEDVARVRSILDSTRQLIASTRARLEAATRGN